MLNQATITRHVQAIDPQVPALNNSVELIIPTTINVSVTADTSAVLRAVERQFALLFGGFTSIPALGGWVDDNGNVVVENVTRVTAMADDKALTDALPMLLTLTRYVVGLTLAQACVSLKINGTLYIVNTR